jgi:hypothetical protein
VANFNEVLAEMLDNKKEWIMLKDPLTTKGDLGYALIDNKQRQGCTMVATIGTTICEMLFLL